MNIVSLKSVKTVRFSLNKELESNLRIDTICTKLVITFYHAKTWLSQKVLHLLRNDFYNIDVARHVCVSGGF